MKIILTVTNGEFAGKKYTFEKKFIMGSSPKSDVVVEDENVSRKQVEISIKSNAVFIKDLKPSGAATLNGQAIPDKGLLKSRDKIKVGSTIFELKILKPKSKSKKEAKESQAPQPLGRTLSDIARTDTEPVSIEQVTQELKAEPVEAKKPVAKYEDVLERAQKQAIEVVTKGKEIKKTKKKAKLREKLGLFSMSYDEMPSWMRAVFVVGVIGFAILLIFLSASLFDSEPPEAPAISDSPTFIPNTGQRIPWTPGTGYETQQKHAPMQAYRFTPSYTECFITDFNSGKITAIGDVEMRDGKELIVFPGAKFTNMYEGEETIKIKDYNGDVCIIPYGAKVEVTLHGVFKLIDDSIDNAKEAFVDMKKKLAALEESAEELPEDEE